MTVTLRKKDDIFTYDLPRKWPAPPKDAPMSVEYFTRFCSALAAEQGCSFSFLSHRRVFTCRPSTQLNPSLVLPETQYISLDQWKLKRTMWSEDEYHYTGVGIVIDGKLVSWCVENSHYLSDYETEIGVWTEHSHRFKGYATSNVVFLCDQLMKMGYRLVVYSTDVQNEAAIGVTRKAGLEDDGEAWHLVFEKKKS